jgi:hypothetical protein
MQRTGGPTSAAGTTTVGISLTLTWNDSVSHAHRTSAAGRREGQGQGTAVKPLDGGSLSLVGNAFAGEGTPGDATTFLPRQPWPTQPLGLAVARLREKGRRQKTGERRADRRNRMPSGEEAYGGGTSIFGHFSGSCGCGAREEGKREKKAENGGGPRPHARRRPHRRRRSSPAMAKSEPAAAAAQRGVHEVRGGEGMGLGLQGATAAAGFCSAEMRARPSISMDGHRRPASRGLDSARAGAAHGPVRRPAGWLLGRGPMRVCGGRPWAAFSHRPKRKVLHSMFCKLF